MEPSKGYGGAEKTEASNDLFRMQTLITSLVIEKKEVIQESSGKRNRIEKKIFCLIFSHE